MSKIVKRTPSSSANKSGISFGGFGMRTGKNDTSDI
jgi:hypothetical protein